VVFLGLNARYLSNLLANLDTMVAFAEKKKESKNYGQASLFGASQEEFPEPPWEEVPDWPEREKLRFEREILGFYFSGHPLEPYRATWEKAVTIDLSHPNRARDDTTHRLLGIVKNIRTVPTKTGKKMAFALLEDFVGSIELVIFTSTLDQYGHKLLEDAIVGITGRIDLSRDRPSFIVEEVKEPDMLESKEVSGLHIALNGSLCTEEDFYQLRSFIIEHPGPCSVYLHFKDPGNGASERVIRASAQLKASGEKEAVQQLQELPGVEEVWVR
jgi:DNA polymerase-3 subunit alpha